MANPFYVSPLGGLDVGQSVTNMANQWDKNELMDMKRTQFEQGQQAQEAQAAQQQRQQQLATAWQNGDLKAGQAMYAEFPEMAAKVDAGMGVQDEKQAAQVGGFFEKLMAQPDLKSKRDYLQRTAGQTPFTVDDDLLAMDDETLERAINVTAPRYLKPEQLDALQGVSAEKGPSAVEETKWFMKQPENVQQAHLKLKRGEQLSADEKVALEAAKSDIKVDEAGRKKTAEGIAGRQQGFIDSGIEAADSLANVRRARKLLDGIKTGGFDRVQLAAKRMFGVESADEAELSANLGKAILAQLKPIFGAAFTAAEGERLEKIEANFGKSTEGNRRLLEQVMKITDRASRRGLKAAEAAGDEFTADEIRASMEMDLEDDLFLMDNDQDTQPMPSGLSEGQMIENPETGQRLILQGGQWVEVQ
jgi:hypothetical protein